MKNSCYSKICFDCSDNDERHLTSPNATIADNYRHKYIIIYEAYYISSENIIFICILTGNSIAYLTSLNLISNI